MQGKDFIKTSTLTVNNLEIPTNALINCRAPGVPCMDQDYAHHLPIPLQESKETRHVEVIIRRPLKSGDITHVANLE
jgi:hypothetical protein